MTARVGPTQSVLAITSLLLAGATALTVTSIVDLAIPAAGNGAVEEHFAVVPRLMIAYRIAAAVGAVLGMSSLAFAAASLEKAEHRGLGVAALLVNLPVPLLSLVILVRA